MTVSGNRQETRKVLGSKLPATRTSFVGRRRERAQVARLLASSRLLTLTGAAGCGKTRLALRVAGDAGERYTGGAHWIALAQVADPALVVQTAAKALGVPEQPGRSSLERLVEALQESDLLVVLDNCEHLLQACAQLAESLLTETKVTILVTSREPLGVTGERRYPVPPLSLPPAPLSIQDVQQLQKYDAVQLFVARARTVLPAFELQAENGPAVAEICRNLDGIPLALELASARVNVLSLEQIVGWLDNHFDLLYPASHITQTHHETLRAAIDWSHNLLSEAEQILLRRLSVFAGGCSLSAAEMVCAGQGLKRERILNLIASLVGKSLLVAETLGRGEARYLLLETIRQYAAEKLEAAGEQDVLRDRHLRCFLQLVEETASKLDGPYQQLWLDWLEGQVGNIRAALAWSLQSKEIEPGLRMAMTLYQFWTIRGYREEGLRWYASLVEEAHEGVSPTVRAKAFTYASLMASFAGDPGAQMSYAQAATRAGEAAGEAGKEALASALGAQAFAAQKSGDFHRAFDLGLRQIALQRELSDPMPLGLSLTLYSFIAMSLEKYDQARAMLDEGLPILRRAGNPYRVAMALNYKGDLARCRQEYAAAAEAYEESIALLREVDAARDLASVLHNQGHATLHLGQVERARALFRESMVVHQEQQNKPGMAECLLGFAALTLADGAPAAAARLLAAAEATGGQQVTSVWRATRLEYQYLLERTRNALPDSAFHAERAAGQRLSLEQTVAYAIETAESGAAAADAGKTLDTLTPRQREVAILVAEGKSNDEIAADLVLSKRTVETHVSHILANLDFNSRTQIVRWAIETGLLESAE